VSSLRPAAARDEVPKAPFGLSKALKRSVRRG
jgi:hypothetical protein